MTSRPLWQGRGLAFAGIVLVAFSLRSAVASLSPLIDHIARDFPVSSVVTGLIGAAPPVCFAVFGLATPLAERRFGLERVAVIAIALMATGIFLRSISGDAVALLATTAVIFAGVGAGNVLLPPLVKKYFPDRIGAMMTVYSTMMAVSTFVPPLFAVPIADLTGWRVSLGLWGVFAAAALVPWVLLLVREPASGGTSPVVAADARMFRRLWRLPLAWALAFVFATSASLAYVSFAWLPTLLVDVGGVSQATAGFLLSVFAMVGLPCSMLVPILVVRFQATRPLFFFAVGAGLASLAGLYFFPTAALPLWAGMLGITALLFPLTLVLLSIRARTTASAVALSGFVQSIGYSMAALSPLLIGVIHDATGGWKIPLLLLAGVLIAAIPAGWVAGRRRTIEDEWERRAR